MDRRGRADFFIKAWWWRRCEGPQSLVFLADPAASNATGNLISPSISLQHIFTDTRLTLSPYNSNAMSNSPLTVIRRCIGRDNSLTFFTSDGESYQLSRHQATVLVQVLQDERGFVPTSQLYGPVFGVMGPATGSQRASMARLTKRLQERGLTTGKQTGVVRLSLVGRAVAAYAAEKSVLC
jgi:hypothetical protein